MQIAKCKVCGRLEAIDKDDPESKHRWKYGDLCTTSDGYTPWQIEQLWELFGDIPVDDDDKIEEFFLGFEEGTYKEVVWRWFDERYPGGVAKLMEKGEKKMDYEKMWNELKNEVLEIHDKTIDAILNINDKTANSYPFLAGNLESYFLIYSLICKKERNRKGEK